MTNKNEYNAYYDELFESNRIYIFEPITDELAKVKIRELLAIQKKFIEDGVPVSEREITVLINSPGGSVSAGYAIIDVLKYLNCKIKTVCVGIAASMAAVILACGNKGFRYAFENSEIMIHQPLGGMQGQASDIRIQAERMQKTKDKINALLASKTGKSPEVVEKDCDRDYFMSATEAKNYGIIDEILNETSEVEI